MIRSLSFIRFDFAVGIFLDAEFLSKNVVDVASAVQYADHLDAAGDRPVEDEVISEPGHGKSAQISRCRVIVIVARTDAGHTGQADESRIRFCEKAVCNPEPRLT